MLSSELIVDLADLEPLQAEWDALAVACALPLMAPALIMAWWRHLAPAGAVSRTIAVREGEQLVGIAPFYVVPSKLGRIDYRLPGIELAARLSPLAAPGREWEVAGVLGQALADARPRPDMVVLEGHPAGSRWPAGLCNRWPGRLRPVLRQYLLKGAPTISLADESYEAWMARKSSNFRSQMRRVGRQFDAAGGNARKSTHETLCSDIETFIRLHATRWEDLGESNLVAIADRLAPMLEDAARELLDNGRFRIWILEVNGEPISAQLFLAADGEVAYVNGGWDERFARFKPAMLGILHAIEDGFARGEKRIDLGAGEQPYKLRFSDGNDPVAWNILMAPGVRLPLTRARTASMLASHALRDTAKRALTAEHVDRLRAIRRRLTT
jgi:CelD/BcsL family acetyltransferase involved in cellulose biosynthesis